MADGRSSFVGESDPQPISLAEPSAQWRAHFEEVRSRLVSALEDGVRVEHVGSTSIPGIRAKPIIDVQISVPDLADEARFVPAIESIGVELRMREPDLGHVYFRDNPRTIHIHVCQVGSTWERNHLLFRDYLRTHPDAARAYEELKHAAVARYGADRLAYTEAKGPFIEQTLAAAEDWAWRTGWQP